MENSNRLFRKTPFGGFNREDVMRYIETMKTEFFDYKAQVEETINDLNEKLSSLQDPDASSAPVDSDESNSAVCISEATNQLRQVAHELLSNLNLVLDRLHLREAAQEPDEALPDSCLEEPKAETPQDKVETLLNTLFTPAETTLQQPADPQKTAKDPDISSVLPHYLNS